MPSPRAKAAVIIHRVLQGKSLNQLLPHSVESLELGQRALCQELVYGTLREWPLYQATCQKFLRKALRRKDHDLLSLICVGLYELDNLEHHRTQRFPKRSTARATSRSPGGRNGQCCAQIVSTEQAGLRETLTPRHNTLSPTGYSTHSPSSMASVLNRSPRRREAGRPCFCA